MSEQKNCTAPDCSSCPKASGAVYTHRNDTGDAEITAYTVFPGIEIIYNAVHMDRCALGTRSGQRIIEIHHCREGRMEQPFSDDFFYLMPGDLSVAIRERPQSEYTFPLRHYHGITIVIDVDRAPQCFSCFLEDVDVEPLTVAQRLCSDRGCFVLRQEKYIEHIFSELYALPRCSRRGYFKVKILELLLVLSGIDPAEGDTPTVSLSREQAGLAKDAAAYLADNMDRRVTVAELSKTFHVSQTHLQNAFKGVYGVPIFSYLRLQKMQSAALQLIHTDRSVMEIASTCGYDNASKFSSAFREVMGETPGEYRRAHRQ